MACLELVYCPLASHARNLASAVSGKPFSATAMVATVHSRVINQARDKVLSAKEFVRQAVARSFETPVTPPVSYTGPTVSSESSCTPVSNFDAGTTERLEGTRLEARFIAPPLLNVFALLAMMLSVWPVYLSTSRELRRGRHAMSISHSHLLT